MAFITSAEAEVLSCTETWGNSRNWLPSNFTLRIHDDRKTISVIRGQRQTFGASDFKKTFGGAYWARGKGRSMSNGDLSYQTKLILKNSNKKYSLTMVTPGFQDNQVGGTCVSKAGSTIEPNPLQTDTLEQKPNPDNASTIFAQCVKSAGKKMSKLEALKFCEDY